jgi:carbon monoxide dehydrogenase subunit G
MDLTGQQLIPASIERTWQALNDPETLKDCINGCDSIVATVENEYSVSMTAKVGPVSARFKGRLRLSELKPPQSYTIHFEGQGGVAGFGKGTASVSLRPEGRSTRLDYSASAQVGGKLAQIGSRLVSASAQKIAEEFFTAFNARVGEEPSSQPDVLDQAALIEDVPQTPERGFGRRLWDAIFGIWFRWGSGRSRT